MEPSNQKVVPYQLTDIASVPFTNNEAVLQQSLGIVEEYMDGGGDSTDSAQYTRHLSYQNSTSQLQIHFMRVILHWYNLSRNSKQAKDALTKILNWLQSPPQHELLNGTKMGTKRLQVSKLCYAENEEFPGWMDHISEDGTRKPAPPVEVWMQLSTAFCRILFAKKQLPAIRIVGAALGTNFFMTTGTYITSDLYSRLQVTLTQKPSNEEIEWIRTHCIPLPPEILATIRPPFPLPAVLPPNAAAIPPAVSAAVTPHAAKKTPFAPAVTPAAAAHQNSDDELSPPPEGADPVKYRERQARRFMKQTRTAQKKESQWLETIHYNSASTANLSSSNATMSGVIDRQEQENSTLNKKTLALTEQNANLCEELWKLRQTLLDRTNKISELLREIMKIESNTEFFEKMSSMCPNSLFYAIADLPENLAMSEQNLQAEGYQHPSVLSCVTSLLTTGGVGKFLSLLAPAVCCFDASLKSLMMLTNSDDREDVTNDHIDSAFYTLLPEIGYSKDHSLSFTLKNLKDYSLAIATRDVGAAAPVGHLAKVIALSGDTTNLCIESSVSEGTAKVPITSTEIQAICFAGGKKSLKDFKMSKAFLDCAQQRAYNTPHGVAPIRSCFDRVEFERENGRVPLLESGPGMGGQLRLFFEVSVGISFDELTDAICRGRVQSLDFEGIQISQGDEAALQRLLRMAREKRCPVSLRRTSHEEMSEQELVDYFVDDHVSPDAFSDAAPTENLKQDDFVVDDAKLKTPHYDIFGELPQDLTKCPTCLAIYKKHGNCGTCDPKKTAGTKPPPSKGTIEEGGFSFGAAPTGASRGGPTSSVFEATPEAATNKFSKPNAGVFSMPDTTGGATGGFFMPDATGGATGIFSMPDTKGGATGGFSMPDATGGATGGFSLPSNSTGGPNAASMNPIPKASQHFGAAPNEVPFAVPKSTKASGPNATIKPPPKSTTKDVREPPDEAPVRAKGAPKEEKPPPASSQEDHDKGIKTRSKTRGKTSGPPQDEGTQPRKTRSKSSGPPQDKGTQPRKTRSKSSGPPRGGQSRSQSARSVLNQVATPRRNPRRGDSNRELRRSSRRAGMPDYKYQG